MPTHTYYCSISFPITSEYSSFDEVLQEEPQKIIAAIQRKLDEITTDGVDSISIECYDAFRDSDEE
jgi:hypothetical protein